MFTRRTVITATVTVAILAIIFVIGKKFLGRFLAEPTPRNEAPISEQSSKLPSLHDARLVIEKQSRRLTVFDGELSIKSYRIGLGWGGGDKQREGDGRTPEGVFYISTKNPNSKFHLSLGLNYPNIEDAQRGLRSGLIGQDQHDEIVEAIESGRTPPWKTPLGGEIMIHGHGSHKDWTAGCVALDNDDIEELYAALPVGTEVKIVRE